MPCRSELAREKPESTTFTPPTRVIGDVFREQARSYNYGLLRPAWRYRSLVLVWVAKNAEGPDVSHACFRLSLGRALTNLPDAAAKSAAGFDRPREPVRQSAQDLFQAFFLCLRYRVAAVVRGIPSGMPDHWFRSVNPRTAATLFV